MKRILLITLTPLVIFYIFLCVLGVKNYLLGYPPCGAHPTLVNMMTCFHPQGITTYFLTLITALFSLIFLSIKHLIGKRS